MKEYQKHISPISEGGTFLFQMAISTKYKRINNA